MSEPEFTSDPWLDARLRNVPLPVGFLARLEEIGNDETREMDRVLRDVPVPDGLLDRLRAISRLPQRRVAWRELAMAASLLLAIGLGYAGFAGVFSKGPGPIAEQLGQPAPGSRDMAGDERRSRDATGVEDLAADSQRPDDLESSPDPETASADLDLAMGDPLASPAAALTPGPPPKLPKIDLAPRLDLYGARIDGRESLPDLDAVEVHVPRGLTPPRVAGYDLLFQLKYGQHPFVSPAAQKELRSVQVPLVTSSASYRRAWRSLNERRLPVADDLRTEDFLAALDYAFPPAPEGAVAIQTAGGPAPLGDGGLSLLQVAVKAGALPHEAHGATHLTIVLDTSVGMRRTDRWAAVERALECLREPMGAADRITLISYNDDPELLVNGADREAAGRLVSALQTVAPRRAANLAAGLALACTVLPRAADKNKIDPDKNDPDKAVRRIVVISSGRVDSGSEAIERTRARVAELAKSGVGLQVLDLGRDEESTSGLATWTQAAEGQLFHVTDPSTLHWNLLEALLGQSPVVAAHTSLKVSFNPDAVAEYRLVGHERTTITGPSLAQTEVDLRSGESASGLFEVRLKPTGGEEVATVEVVWHKSEHAPAQVVKQRVTRSQFARTFAASAPALQSGAVAALTAETLRGSYFGPVSHSLARVIELTKQVNPAVQYQPSFRELLVFIQRAERLRTHGAKGLGQKPAAAAVP